MADHELNDGLRADDEHRTRERIWRVAERIGERNRNRDPDEVVTIVTEVVEDVRRERHERKQTGA